MAWTDPSTVSVSQLGTAALWNQQVRDNFKWIGGADGRGTTFPASPVDGQLFTYTADATNGVQWRFQYNSGSASTFKWEYIGGAPLRAAVETDESTTSGTFVDLATAGPSITVPRAGDYLVHLSINSYASAQNTNPVAAPKFAAAATSAPDGVQWAHASTVALGANGESDVVRTGMAASDVIKVQYTSSGGATTNFRYRRLFVTPIRVS